MSLITAFMSKRDTCAKTGKSRATIWRWVRDGRFPTPVQIGPNSVAWRVSGYQEWAADPVRWREMHATGAES